MFPRESAASEGRSNGTTLANVRYSANSNGLGSCSARVPGFFLEALVEPAEEILDALGDQQRGQASGYAAERNVRDAQQPYLFQGAVGALEEIGAAPERAGRYRYKVGGEI